QACLGNQYPASEPIGLLRQDRSGQGSRNQAEYKGRHSRPEPQAKRKGQAIDRVERRRERIGWRLYWPNLPDEQLPGLGRNTHFFRAVRKLTAQLPVWIHGTVPF